VISNHEYWSKTKQEKWKWIGHTLRKGKGVVEKDHWTGTLKEIEVQEDLFMVYLMTLSVAQTI
jgi:hypothetical protein